MAASISWSLNITKESNIARACMHQDRQRTWSDAALAAAPTAAAREARRQASLPRSIDDLHKVEMILSV
jgi:hypothetical protein